jgi:hypothetical protein
MTIDANYFYAATLAAWAVAAILLNVSYWRRRKKMTPEERKKADDELSFEIRNW